MGVTCMLLPNDAIKKLVKDNIEKWPHLCAILQGVRPFPIRISLKIPTAKEALANIVAYQEFVSSWREYEHQSCVERTNISYQCGLDGRMLPSYLVVGNIDDLLQVIPKKHKDMILKIMSRVAALNKALNLIEDETTSTGSLFVSSDNGKAYKLNIHPHNNLSFNTQDGQYVDEQSNMPVPRSKILFQLSKNLAADEISEEQIHNLCLVLPQLKRNMGYGLYIRAIPLKNLDTKFLEKNENIITLILRHVDILSPNETLTEFLGVLPKAEGFAHIRYLDPKLTNSFTYFQVLTSELIDTEPQGSKILIVENVQSGLMLPKLHNTTVIFGCGKNIAWTKALWFQNKERIVYWGDIDSWGFEILATVRKNSPVKVTSVLMDLQTIQARHHKTRMVQEEKSTNVTTELLTQNENEALKFLKDHPLTNRLEQEKLDQDYVLTKIKAALELSLTESQ